jgi:hypothetical protein
MYIFNITKYFKFLTGGLCFAHRAVTTQFGKQPFFNTHDNGSMQTLRPLALTGGGTLYGVPEKKTYKIRDQPIWIAIIRISALCKHGDLFLCRISN